MTFRFNLKQKESKMKKIFYDLETTGLDAVKNGIHQIAGCVEIDGEVKEYFNFKLAPHSGCLISDEALKVAGVSKEEIFSYPTSNEVFKAFLSMLSKYVDKYNKMDKFFLYGYNNASFDNQFLRNWFIVNGDNYFGSWFWSNTGDIMVLATEKLLDKRAGMENFKLKTVAKTLGIVIDETKLHDAGYDIELTREVYYRSK